MTESLLPEVFLVAGIRGPEPISPRPDRTRTRKNKILGPDQDHFPVKPSFPLIRAQNLKSENFETHGYFIF